MAFNAANSVTISGTGVLTVGMLFGYEKFIIEFCSKIQ
jgi:hypothetical protein